MLSRNGWTRSMSFPRVIMTMNANLVNRRLCLPCSASAGLLDDPQRDQKLMASGPYIELIFQYRRRSGAAE
jgi:hypothetical protein